MASIKTSLEIRLRRGDQVNAASSYFQLGVLYGKLQDFGKAQEHLLLGLAIVEPLSLPNLWKFYGILAEVAEASGDSDSAAEWKVKRDAKLAEVQRLAGSGGIRALPEKVAQSFMGLAQTVYATRASGAELPLELGETLAQLKAQPEPLASAGSFLRAVADGGSPPVPAGLPEPLPKIFGGLLASLE